MRLKLPIYYYKDDINPVLEDIIKDRKSFPLEQIFYSIDSIAPSLDNPDETIIYSGYQVYVCPLPLREVDKRIDMAKSNELVSTITKYIKN